MGCPKDYAPESDIQADQRRWANVSTYFCLRPLRRDQQEWVFIYRIIPRIFMDSLALNGSKFLDKMSPRVKSPASDQKYPIWLNKWWKIIASDKKWKTFQSFVEFSIRSAPNGIWKDLKIIIRTSRSCCSLRVWLTSYFARHVVAARSFDVKQAFRHTGSVW